MTQREHLPEVLPAPPDSGTEVRAVPGNPSTAAESVPGRRPVAMVSGGLAVVLLPVLALLLAAPAAPGFMLIWAAVWIAIAAVCWLLDQRTPRRWPGWALLAVAPPVIADLVFAAPLGLLGLVALVSAPLVARAASRRCTALAADLAELDVETVLPAGTSRLRIGRDRVVLVRGAVVGGGHVDHALPLAELSLAQPGEITAEEARWPLPGGVDVRLRRGPAVRLVAGNQQWVLPVEDPRLVADIVRRRGTAAWSQRTGPQDLGSWRALREWAVARTTTYRHGGKKQAHPAFRAPVGFLAAMLGTGLLATAAGRALTDPGVWTVGAVAAALGGYFVVAWLRVRKRLEFAELQQLPPHSPPWGDRRPDFAPIPDWRPWR
ncbi:hypothetical protein SAMN05421805_11694 [Saccharopolyspora antimicrobica]|uniref:Uncharacterized protein n=1 Tax=Saccharopolyspora antimicrobica TaxID=455193 RepID=A0A1I5HSZ5_9PSEU|nr:hypothetical protein [Saccharopolyspora antimicrobica]RKT82338.1 hypothetical protein ATL45_0583 [Saccharopolyspora antimicrobica]SFO51444.1 hypothetical protein SAMN05421805_11694 [Saccharopolyspora antimicrobica]